jgi:hypothetical protein
MSIATPRALALDGGWKVHAPGSASLLQDPYRHHLVTGRVGDADSYVLPPAVELATLLGRGVPRGTVVWVHNVPPGSDSWPAAGLADFVGYAVGSSTEDAAGGTVTVRNASSSFTDTVPVNTSSAFLLVDDSTAAGVWVALVRQKPNARGPTQPSGYRFTLNLRRSQNAVHVLQRAVEDGYDGTEPALVRVRVWPNVVLGSYDKLVAALDMGGDSPIEGINWASGSAFFLVSDGFISGKGGDAGSGGVGGTGASAGTVGEDGGLAIRAPNSLTITNNGIIQGGGGGGGGGNGQAATPGLHGGGGGGGAGANVDARGVVRGGRGGFAANGAVRGTDGTLFTAGAWGVGSLVPPNVGGHGGSGGAPASAGGYGQTLNNGPDDAAGGPAGPAISRASGATITFLVAGTVTGATVVA